MKPGRGPRGLAPARRAVFVFALMTPVASYAEEPVSRGMVVDRAVVRYYAPDLGGTEQPRFIGERVLAFETRLEAMTDSSTASGDTYDEPRVRAALDRHVSVEMAATLAHKLIAGWPPSRRPSQTDLLAVKVQLTTAVFERLGGKERVDAAARAEQLDESEVDDFMDRQALAVWYIDRAVTPVLQTTEEQLREVFRTGAHPYRGQSFNEARAALQRWLVVERVRVAEAAFLQGVRSRIRIIVTR